jgi:hypothetical protein
MLPITNEVNQLQCLHRVDFVFAEQSAVLRSVLCPILSCCVRTSHHSIKETVSGMETTAHAHQSLCDNVDS